MKPPPITVRIHHQEQHVRLQFSDNQDVSFYWPIGNFLSLSTFGHCPNSWHIADWQYQGIMEPNRLVIFTMPDATKSDIETANCRQYGMNTLKFARELFRQHRRWKTALDRWVAAGHRDYELKWPDQVMDLRRFQFPHQNDFDPIPVWRMIRHVNFCGKSAEEIRHFVGTMRNFHRHLPPDKWQNFIERFSSYVRAAKFGGSYDLNEFWFDGRSSLSGRSLGFNGIFLLRINEQEPDKSEFSIHT